MIERIISFLKKDTRILAVYLLGSAGAGRLRPDSDIDLALLPVSGRHIDEFERVKLAADIALEIGREVDIGVISSNPKFLPNFVHNSLSCKELERFQRAKRRHVNACKCVRKT